MRVFQKISRQLSIPVILITSLIALLSDPCAASSKPAAGADHAKEEKKSKLEHTNTYVHEWVPFPKFEAIALPDGGKFSFKPMRGEMPVIILTASWCTPCVKLMPEILRLQARTARLPVKYIQIFTHDTKQDALAFMSEYKIRNATLATHEVLATFKNPELPAIFVGDRNKFMLARYLKATKKNLAEVEDAIKYLTAL